MSKPAQILDFWFGPGQTDVERLAQAGRWWKKDPDFDQQIRDEHLHDWKAALHGDLDHWTNEPASCLAFVVVLDQFTRNMFRDSPRMFAGDVLALRATFDALHRGLDASLSPVQRSVLLMPLMHAEDVRIQQISVARFRALADSAPDDVREGLNNNVKYAIAHANIIERFGRYPHRNALLGRPSTEEELAFLQQPNSSF